MLSPRTLLWTVSPRTLPRMLSPRTLLWTVSPRTLPRMLSPRTLLWMLSPRTLPRMLSPRTLSRMLSPRTLLWTVSPRTLLRMSPWRPRDVSTQTMNDDTDQVDALRRMLTAQANEIESLRSTQRVDWSHRIDPLAADAIRSAIRMLTPYTAAIPL